MTTTDCRECPGTPNWRGDGAKQGGYADPCAGCKPTFNPWRRARQLEARVAELEQRLRVATVAFWVLHGKVADADASGYHRGFAAGVEAGAAETLAAMEGETK